MTTLSTTEVQLIDEYFIRHNFTTVDEPHFLSALGNIVPSWRFEDLAGHNKVYEFTTCDAYLDYINQLTNDKRTNI
jgi:hypothetical protein